MLLVATGKMVAKMSTVANKQKMTLNIHKIESDIIGRVSLYRIIFLTPDRRISPINIILLRQSSSKDQMEELGNVVRRATSYHVKSPNSKTAQVSILCEKR
jgi:hypothetical protein